MQICPDGGRRGYTSTLLKRRIVSMDTNSLVLIDGESPYISGRIPKRLMVRIPLNINILNLAISDGVSMEDQKSKWILLKYKEDPLDVVTVALNPRTKTPDNQSMKGAYQVYQAISKMRGHHVFSWTMWKECVEAYSAIVVQADQDTTSGQTTA
jgi:hypothetical protein